MSGFGCGVKICPEGIFHNRFCGKMLSGVLSGSRLDFELAEERSCQSAEDTGQFVRCTYYDGSYIRSEPGSELFFKWNYHTGDRENTRKAHGRIMRVHDVLADWVSDRMAPCFGCRRLFTQVTGFQYGYLCLKRGKSVYYSSFIDRTECPALRSETDCSEGLV